MTCPSWRVFRCRGGRGWAGEQRLAGGETGRDERGRCSNPRSGVSISEPSLGSNLSTEHSRRWFRKHFETQLNLRKSRVLIESFFKGKKPAQGSMHYSGAAVAIRMAARGWRLSPNTVCGGPVLPPGPTPTPIFPARELFSPVKPLSL